MKKKLSYFSISILFSILFLLGNFNFSTNLESSVNKSYKDYQSWTINDIQAGFNFYVLWATDDQGIDHIYTWGENDYGQLGVGTTTANYTPQEITYPSALTTNPKNHQVQKISVGGTNVMVDVKNTTDDTTSLYSWGEDTYGELGNGSTENITSPTEMGSSVFSGETIINIEAASGSTFVSTVDDSNDSHVYASGKGIEGQLGIGSSANKTSYTEISYNDALISDQSSFDVKGIYTADNPEKQAFTSYLLIENRATGYDSILITGEDDPNYAGFAGQFSASSGQDNLTSFTELTNYPPGYDSSQLTIKQFYTSYIGENYFLTDGYGVSYQGIVLTDSSNQDHLYTFGVNSGGNIANGKVDDNNFNVQTSMYEVDFSSTGIGTNYTIENVGGNYYSSYAILKDSTGEEHVYYWGNDSGEGLSTFEDPNASGAEYGSIFTTPVEINYSDDLDLSTTTVQTMGFSYSNGFMLTKDDQDNQTLYMWGNNSNNIVSTSNDNYIYQPTIIYTDTPQLDNFLIENDDNLTTIEFNINGTYTLLNEFKIENTTTGNDQIIDSKDFKITNEGSFTHYSYSQNNLIDLGKNEFSASYTSNYFPQEINTGFILSDSLLSEETSYLIIIIIFSLLALIVILTVMALIINGRANKKREKAMKEKLDNYS